MKTIFYTREEYNEISNRDISEEEWSGFDLYPVKGRIIEESDNIIDEHE